MIVHKDLAKGRWFALALAEQLGNAGSEFSRAISWRNKGNKDKFAAATERFFELMLLTLADPRWRGPRRRELARLQEQAAEALLEPNFPAHPLQQYFDRFALAARAKQQK